MSGQTEQLVKDLSEGRITIMQLGRCINSYVAQRDDLSIEAKKILCGDLVDYGIGPGVITTILQTMWSMVSSIDRCVRAD